MKDREGSNKNKFVTSAVGHILQDRFAEMGSSWLEHRLTSVSSGPNMLSNSKKFEAARNSLAVALL